LNEQKKAFVNSHLFKTAHRQDSCQLLHETMVNYEVESRPQESEQDDKWSFCLTAGTLCQRIRRDDEQTTAPEPYSGLQGESGAGRHQGRSNAWPTGGAF